MLVKQNHVIFYCYEINTSFFLWVYKNVSFKIKIILFDKTFKRALPKLNHTLTKYLRLNSILTYRTIVRSDASGVPWLLGAWGRSIWKAPHGPPPHQQERLQNYFFGWSRYWLTEGSGRGGGSDSPGKLLLNWIFTQLILLQLFI